MFVVGGKELLQRTFSTRVDRITNCGDVALGITAVLLILVGIRVVDIPVFFDTRVLIFLVVVALLDQLVKLERLDIRL